MSRIRLLLQYHGAAYNGWQVQPGQPTVQGAVEAAVARIEGAPVAVTASGRTDAGVHALAQVAHFDTARPHSTDTWQKALNANLPSDIAVLSADRVADGFHARFSAVGKHYRYRILNREARCPFRKDRSWHLPRPIDVAAMSDAAAHLVGEHDFSSFRASGCGARSPVRRLDRITIVRERDEVVFDLFGGGFLKQMVRNLVGTLIQVGLRVQPPEWVARVRDARDRTRAGETAPAWGLTLVSVDYPGLSSGD